ncbi:MAG: hypothetical protein JKY54_19880, partial [Flavobacteriales bacterium]|nr:hypothetical protein [Flavobacteriales bacterium]
VINNSDQPNFNNQFVVPNSFPVGIDTMIQKGSVGEVYGPFIVGNSYRIAKIIQADSAYEARVRHILISVNQQNQQME